MKEFCAEMLRVYATSLRYSSQSRPLRRLRDRKFPTGPSSYSSGRFSQKAAQLFDMHELGCRRPAAANTVWTKTLAEVTASLCETEPNGANDLTQYEDELDAYSIADVLERLKQLPPLTTGDINGDDTPEEEFLPGFVA